jgi:CBS domain-containing protein
MISPVVTVTGDELVDDALRLMHEKRIRRLPVVAGDKLVGLVTRDGLREAVPASPIPLSIWGTHYQLSRLRVRDVMITGIITIRPDMTIQEAAALGTENKIGTLPAVDDNGNLVGIMTTTDLYRLLTRALGFGRKGLQIRVSAGESLDQHQVMAVIGRHKVDFRCAFWETPPGSTQSRFSIYLVDEEAPGVVSDLKKQGFEVEAD